MLLLLLVHLACSVRAGDVTVEPGELLVTDQPADAVEAARTALQAGRFDEAASAWEALAEAGGGPGARLAQAVALYEAGYLRRARTTAEQVLAAQPKNVAALNVLGLAQVDGGAVEAGVATLEKARGLASGRWKARVGINLALARYDQGNAEAARAALAEASALAGDDAALGAALTTARNTIAALDGQDPGVGAALGRGDTAAARSTAKGQETAAASRRDRITARLLLAAVERAEGKLDASAERLQGVLKDATEAGFTREVALAQGNLGVVHSLAGRQPLAIDALHAGVQTAQAGGYRIVEADLRCELGLAYLRADDIAAAKNEQRAAGTLLGGMSYLQGVARQAELGGAIAALEGDLATADAALGKAVDGYEKQGRFLDAGRAATTAAAAAEGVDPARATRWTTRAEGLFQRAGDPLGPAHVYIARGLAAARANRTDAALAAFGKAAELAGASTTERGRTVSRVARENAARVLTRMGDSPDAARRAAESGLGDMVTRERNLSKGFKAYDAGLAAYQVGDWAGAETKFAEARKAFEVLKEDGYTQRTRKAAGWARYNALVATPVAKAGARWKSLVEETSKLDDSELFLRTYAASALADHQNTSGDPAARLAECARRAEAQSQPELAARCHGALAERTGAIEDRARHARLAFGFAPEEAAAVYALYVVAVDAVNEDKNALAIELATLALPRAGKLQPALDDVLRTARP